MQPYGVGWDSYYQPFAIRYSLVKVLSTTVVSLAGKRVLLLSCLSYLDGYAVWV